MKKNVLYHQKNIYTKQQKLQNHNVLYPYITISILLFVFLKKQIYSNIFLMPIIHGKIGYKHSDEALLDNI